MMTRTKTQKLATIALHNEVFEDIGVHNIYIPLIASFLPDRDKVMLYTSSKGLFYGKEDESGTWHNGPGRLWFSTEVDRHGKQKTASITNILNFEQERNGLRLACSELLGDHHSFSILRTELRNCDALATAEHEKFKQACDLLGKFGKLNNVLNIYDITKERLKLVEALTPEQHVMFLNYREAARVKFRDCPEAKLVL